MTNSPELRTSEPRRAAHGQGDDVAGRHRLRPAPLTRRARYPRRVGRNPGCVRADRFLRDVERPRAPRRDARAVGPGRRAFRRVTSPLPSQDSPHATLALRSDDLPLPRRRICRRRRAITGDDPIVTRPGELLRNLCLDIAARPPRPGRLRGAVRRRVSRCADRRGRRKLPGRPTVGGQRQGLARSHLRPRSPGRSVGAGASDPAAPVGLRRLPHDETRRALYRRERREAAPPRCVPPAMDRRRHPAHGTRTAAHPARERRRRRGRRGRVRGGRQRIAGRDVREQAVLLARSWGCRSAVARIAVVAGPGTHPARRGRTSRELLPHQRRKAPAGRRRQGDA
jgi:hypothetical protein